MLTRQTLEPPGQLQSGWHCLFSMLVLFLIPSLSAVLGLGGNVLPSVCFKICMLLLHREFCVSKLSLLVLYFLSLCGFCPYVLPLLIDVY